MEGVVNNAMGFWFARNSETLFATGQLRKGGMGSPSTSAPITGLSRWRMSGFARVVADVPSTFEPMFVTWDSGSMSADWSQCLEVGLSVLGFRNRATFTAAGHVVAARMVCKCHSVVL